MKEELVDVLVVEAESIVVQYSLHVINEVVGLTELVDTSLVSLVDLTPELAEVRQV